MSTCFPPRNQKEASKEEEDKKQAEHDEENEDDDADDDPSKGDARNRCGFPQKEVEADEQTAVSKCDDDVFKQYVGFNARSCSRKFHSYIKIKQLWGYAYDRLGTTGSCFLLFRPANLTCALSNPMNFVSCQDRRLKKSRVCARMDETLQEAKMTKCDDDVLQVRRDVSLKDCSISCRKRGYEKCWGYTYSAELNKCILQRRAPNFECEISKKAGADDYRVCQIPDGPRKYQASQIMSVTLDLDVRKFTLVQRAAVMNTVARAFHEVGCEGAMRGAPAAWSKIEDCMHGAKGGEGEEATIEFGAQPARLAPKNDKGVRKVPEWPYGLKGVSFMEHDWEIEEFEKLSEKNWMRVCGEVCDNISGVGTRNHS